MIKLSCQPGVLSGFLIFGLKQGTDKEKQKSPACTIYRTGETRFVPTHHSQSLTKDKNSTKKNLGGQKSEDSKCFQENLTVTDGSWLIKQGPLSTRSHKGPRIFKTSWNPPSMSLC